MAFIENLNFNKYIHRMPTIWELRNMLHFSCVQRAGPFNHNLHHISMSKWSDALQMGWKISVICHNESRHVAKLPRFSYIYFSGQKKVNQFGKCLGYFPKIQIHAKNIEFMLIFFLILQVCQLASSYLISFIVTKIIQTIERW